MAQLRRALRDAGGEYKIYKNTLVRFAARDLGLETRGRCSPGRRPSPSSRATPSTWPRRCATSPGPTRRWWSRAACSGEKVLEPPATRALAEVEPREVLLAQLAGAMAAPMQQFAGLLQALPRNLAYGLKALIDQQGGVPEARPKQRPT